MNSLLFSPRNNINIQGATAKVVLVLWALWSGKTHFINSLLPYTPEKTKILVNDIWSINIDAKRLKNPNITTLSEWCVCCEDIWGLRKALIDAKTSDMIIIEPTWIAGWDDILSLVKSLWFDIRVITLQDIQHFWESKPNSTRTPEENKVREVLMEILKNQIQVADIIGYTKMSEKFSEVQDWVKNINKTAKGYIIPKESWENMWENPQVIEIFQKLQESTTKQVGMVLSIKKEKSAPSHKNPLKTHSWTQEIQNLSFEGLKKYLEKNPQIIRAKWVIENISFNYTLWSLDIEWYSESQNCANFISPENLEIPENISMNSQMSSEKTYEMIPKEKFQEKIDILISQYHERINLNKQKKLLEGDTEKNAQKIKILEVTIKMLEDDMKYDNPHIWLEYKIEAYKNSSSEINTIADFKKHAQSPTYICHKRLHFLNKAMKEKFGKDIFDENLDQNMWVREFFAWDDKTLSLDEDFMKLWLQYEYFEIQGETKKWENFSK